MAKGLLALGLGKGARVGVILPCGTDGIVAWSEVSRIGGIEVALSTFASPAELHYTVHHADCAVLLTADRYLGHDYTAKLEEAFPEVARRRAGSPIHDPACPYLRHIFFSGEAPAWSDGTFGALASPALARGDLLLAAVEAAVRE